MTKEQRRKIALSGNFLRPRLLFLLLLLFLPRLLFLILPKMYPRPLIPTHGQILFTFVISRLKNLRQKVAPNSTLEMPLLFRRDPLLRR